MKRRIGIASAVMAAVVPALMLATASPASADARQCTLAPGPGDTNDSCIQVWGDGTWVGEVEVWLSSSKYAFPLPGLYPADVCNVKLDVWGQGKYGGHFEQTYTNTGCAKGTLGARFNISRTAVDGSYLCGRTTWNGMASKANCVIVHS
ncbi:MULTISPECIES: hypothetical protein [Streptomyces]|uniref:Secreted protein n=1 Tax=Streptomyces desertarenae TaxID=2666184 RepID=A0ABW4PSJ6_9ACTN